jgi:hypothetical protein
MSHRFPPLEAFEAELSRVVEQPAGDPARRWPRLPIRRRARWGLILALTAVVLAGGTISLAATGVILTGSAVPATAPVGPSEGVGDPSSSRLLPLRVADPAGGLPWGMRIVETSRGLVCAQVGRVHDGQLGELGSDGAFGNDGLFHPFPAGVVQTFPGGSTEDGTEIEGGTCTLAPSGARATAWGSAVAAELWGVDRNAAPSRAHSVLPAGQGRDISYGLLGPHAMSVTYREGSAVRTEPVVPGVGAYLVVQRAGAGSDHEGSGEAPGTQTPGEGPGTDGAVTTITYSVNGTTCENGYDARTGAKVAIGRACPSPSAPPPVAQTAQAGRFKLDTQVHLRVRSHRVLAAEISFTAPFAVRGAAEGYSLWSRGCGAKESGATAAVFNRDVARGGRVHLVLQHPFAAACEKRAEPVEILFESSEPNAAHSAGRSPGRLLLATTTIRLPAGDIAAAPPR